MKCPACKSGTMQERHGGVFVPICGSCGLATDASVLQEIERLRAIVEPLETLAKTADIQIEDFSMFDPPHWIVTVGRKDRFEADTLPEALAAAVKAMKERSETDDVS